MGKLDCSPKKNQLKKGPWTREEDQKLLSYIEQHGHGSWRSLPPKAGLERCGKSCRLRWTNYLRPDIKRGKFSTHEEKSIIRLHALLGNRWSAIAAHLPKRTDNEIKNYWNTRLKKRLTRMGIDPATHKPKVNGSSAQSRHSADLSHMAQWETARLEAESRLARASKLHILNRFAAPPPPCLPRLPCLDVLRAWQANSGSLESPTSTLSFSCVAVPAVSSVAANENYAGSCGVGQGMMVVEERGKMENSFSGDCNDNLAYHVEFDNEFGGMEVAAPEYYSDQYNVDVVGEFEDVKDYWNELLNMVSSPVVPGL